MFFLAENNVVLLKSGILFSLKFDNKILWGEEYWNGNK